MLQNETNLKTRFGLKKLEHTEKMADKVVGFFEKRREQKLIEAERRRKASIKTTIISIFAAVISLIGCFLMVNASAKKSKMQEKSLQQMVDLIQIDITNGDYDAAYVKASALNYTAGHSSTTEKKWDETRESFTRFDR